MKYLTSESSDMIYYKIIMGINRLFDDVVILSEGQHIYDVVDKNPIDVVFMDSSMLTQDFIMAYEEYKFKLVLFGVEHIDKFATPPSLLCVPKSTPDKLFDNLSQEFHNVLRIGHTADIGGVSTGEPTHVFDCDVLFLSETNNMTVQLDALSELLLVGCNLKIFGSGRVALPQYLGTVTVKDYPNLLKSCKIVVDFTGNLLLDCAAAKTFAVSNVPNNLFPVYERENLTEIVRTHLDNPKKCGKIAKSAYRKVISADTNLHTILDIAKLLNIDHLATAAQTQLDKLCVVE